MTSFDKTLTNTCRVETDWVDPDGRQAKNVWYANGADYSNVSNLETVAEAVGDLWTTETSGFALYQLFGSGWSLEGYVVSDNGGTSEAQYTLSGPGLTPSGSPGPPPNCCTLISWAIGASYRGGHPRTYMPPGPHDTLTVEGGNNWGTAYVNNVAAKLAAGWTAAQTDMGSGKKFGTIAASRGGSQLTPPVFYEFLSVEVKPRVCTQRRRLGKTGG